MHVCVRWVVSVHVLRPEEEVRHTILSLSTLLSWNRIFHWNWSLAGSHQILVTPLSLVNESQCSGVRNMHMATLWGMSMVTTSSQCRWWEQHSTVPTEPSSQPKSVILWKYKPEPLAPPEANHRRKPVTGHHLVVYQRQESQFNSKPIVTGHTYWWHLSAHRWCHFWLHRSGVHLRR